MKKSNIKKIPEQKKDFLNADLTDRMIRVEQKVSFSFNKKKVKAEDTEYYKSLNLKQKEEYSQFLKHKKKKNSIFLALLLAPLFVVAFFRMSLTGNVIVENGTITFTSFELTLIGLFILLVLLGLVFLLEKKLIEWRLGKHVKLIQHILARKYVN